MAPHFCSYRTVSGSKLFPTYPQLSVPTSQPRHPLQRKRFIGCSPSKPPPTRIPIFCSLKWWSLQINQHTYHLLLNRSSARDRALFRCLTDRHTNTWLQPCPTENLGLRLTPAEYTALSKLHLGTSASPSLPPIPKWFAEDAVSQLTFTATTSSAAEREDPSSVTPPSLRSCGASAQLLASRHAPKYPWTTHPPSRSPFVSLAGQLM